MITMFDLFMPVYIRVDLKEKDCFIWYCGIKQITLNKKISNILLKDFCIL